MNQGSWMPKGSDGVNDGEMNYGDSYRMNQKRSHQWFIDGPEVELFSIKKQAVGTTAYVGTLDTNAFGNSSSFQSATVPFVDRFLDSETVRTVDYDDRNVPSIGLVEVNMSHKLGEDPIRIGYSHGLSMSHMKEHPITSLNYGGIRKVKVCQVKESESQMPTKSVEHMYDGTAVSAGETYTQENNIFISMGQSYCKENDNTSVSQTHMGNNIGSVEMRHVYCRGSNGTLSMAQTYNPINDNLSTGQSYSKGDGTIVLFGGCGHEDTNPSGKLTSNYELFVDQQSLQIPGVINERELVIPHADMFASAEQNVVPRAENFTKMKADAKMSKKAHPNSFPSNVRSLLSTGMLDGVPVKYVAVSRGKELRGVIKGSGYLCGCQMCNSSKVVNAYEFERHAGCKTKHPNNHIYFQNGKSIYSVVQELKNTPPDMLFDVIQTIFGSPINQKSFRLWKESFLAATRELQRIYGEDET